MSELGRHLENYLVLRRGLGYKLDRAGRLLAQLVAFCDREDAEVVSVELAVSWATSPPRCSAMWAANRLCVARGFLRYLHAFDPRTGVPPTKLLASAPTRATPYLYSHEEVAALMSAAHSFRSRLRAAGMEAVVGLLACSGMRIGEVLALDRGDVDLDSGVITIHRAKLDKERMVPLHSTTVEALGAYVSERDRLSPRPSEVAFFVSAAGTRIRYCNFHLGYQQMVRLAGITARSAACRPRPHDLRHRFAVNTLEDWYREGADVAARLPRLSTYLGHVDPAATYWYLSGSLKLLGLAAERLEMTYEAKR